MCVCSGTRNVVRTRINFLGSEDILAGPSEALMLKGFKVSVRHSVMGDRGWE